MKKSFTVEGLQLFIKKGVRVENVCGVHTSCGPFATTIEP
jgi:hypothetical protein